MSEPNRYAVATISGKLICDVAVMQDKTMAYAQLDNRNPIAPLLFPSRNYAQQIADLVCGRVVEIELQVQT